MSTAFEHEQRRMKRVDCVIDVEFACDSPFMKGHLTDISAYGIFIDTPTTLPTGCEVDVRFTLPGIPEIVTKGNVAWVQDRIGMGIEFKNLSEDQEINIVAFMQKMG